MNLVRIVASRTDRGWVLMLVALLAALLVLVTVMVVVLMPLMPWWARQSQLSLLA